MLRLTILLLTSLSLAGAGEVPLTLESAPAYALRHHPGLAAARLRIEEARGRLRQAGRLANPELELEVSRNVGLPEGTVGLAFTQRFPVNARLRLEKAVSRAELEAAEAELRNAERLLATEVSTAAVTLLALNGQKALRLRQLQNSRELSEFTHKRVQNGEAAPADASLVELEARQLQTEILQLEVERAGALGQLRGLLGTPPGEDPAFTGTLPGLRDGLARAAGAGARPDLQAAQSTAEAARQTSRLAQAQRWQDIGASLNVTGERRKDAPDGYERELFAGVKVSVPLPLWNDNAGRIHEAAAAALRAEKETGALELTIAAEAAAARDAMAALSALVASLERELLPAAAHLEEQLRASYGAGQTTLSEVLRARDRRLLIERQHAEALRDYHLARVRHAAATGAILPRSPAP